MRISRPDILSVTSLSSVLALASIACGAPATLLAAPPTSAQAPSSVGAASGGGAHCQSRWDKLVEGARSDGTASSSNPAPPSVASPTSSKMSSWYHRPAQSGANVRSVESESHRGALGRPLRLRCRPSRRLGAGGSRPRHDRCYGPPGPGSPGHSAPAGRHPVRH
jgi:hypothetical protein